jgi:hypothetical protein
LPLTPAEIPEPGVGAQHAKLARYLRGWVEVRDDLSLSLLQTSLIELSRPIRVVVEGG